MEGINKILKEEYRIEESRDKDINPLYGNENKINSDKIYISVDGSVRSDGPPKDYNGKDAKTNRVKELTKIIS